MTNRLSNVLNQHTWMALSKQSFSANCTGFVCVRVFEREGGNKEEHVRFRRSRPEGDSAAHM